ncbi:Hypothetical predicted protein [Cloeon dipterum]|uniref:Aquaporin n=1 Tax=Cloeon dipterum TaxID=197152 RepID=A0A8S1DJZ1_9INSE|nr:Hypothetical predicted protein [Cloeon dipterum]
MEENGRAVELLQEALQTLQNEANAAGGAAGPRGNGGVASTRAELRSLHLWRAIIAECVGAFLFVLLVCGAAAHHADATALAIGAAAAALVLCFDAVSGAHLSPAVTFALAATRNISPIRAVMFIAAQCGGGIAGAALLYGMSASPGMLQLAVLPGATSAAPWQLFTQEVVLTFLVALCYFVSSGATKAPAVGAAYLAATLTATAPALNPARALGPSFVLHRWEAHWVFWVGPLLGALLAGALYEFILNPSKFNQRNKGSSYADSSSVRSDPDNYEDLDKGCAYNSLRNRQPISPISPGLASASNYCLNIKSAAAANAEPIYSPRSMYSKSPALTRANLNRSQSVYAKSPPGPPPGMGVPGRAPLSPAQSLYPGMVCRTFNVPRPSHTSVYQLRSQPHEPIYGQRQPSASPESSSYGSYKLPAKPPRDFSSLNSPAVNY